MLGGRFMDKTISNYFNNYLVFDSYLQVSLGVARTFENEPTLLVLPLNETLRIDDQTTTDMVGFRIFNYDPTLAPEGKTAIVATLGTKNYRYWTELRKYDKEKYQAEKLRIARVLIDLLEKRLGNVTEYVEEVDVSSPATVIRYTNNWKGSFEGWVLTPEIGLKQMKKELPGLKNFYMIGQWVAPGGGLPAGLITGRHVAQIICKKDKKAFITKSF
jgi:phytoene dehydrogenase-like protein